MFSLQDYTFDLPKDRIAETATQPAHNAKLMIIEKKSGTLSDEATFWDLPDFLDEDRVLFFNNSRVVRARIPLKDTKILHANGSESLISNGEIFFLKKLSDTELEALVRPGKKFKIGTQIFLKNSIVEVEWMTNEWRKLTIKSWNIDTLMEELGQLPLPPYIEYQKEKEKDYQTVFAEKNGSVAAPTASLHFTESLLDKIPNEKIFLTLHVWLGTFKWIDTDDVREYQIHNESVEVAKNIFTTIANIKTQNKKIVAIGTTACRTLESLPSVWQNFSDEQKSQFPENVILFWNQITQWLSPNDWIWNLEFDEETIRFETQIYITPEYEFRVINEIITNFHLPGSSLIVLIASIIGLEQTLTLYKYAIENNYRFFSLGDGMYIRE